MDSQTQDKIYIALVKYWRLSYKSANLVQILQKEQFIHNIRSLVSNIKVQHENTSDLLIREIYSKSLKNIHFMVRDLLDARLDRIICFCRQQKKINEDLLLPEEIDFYRGLFTSFRGYNASKNMVLDDILPHQTRKSQKKISPSGSSPGSKSTSLELDAISSDAESYSEKSLQNDEMIPIAGDSLGSIETNPLPEASKEELSDIPEEFPYDIDQEEEHFDEDFPPAEILDEMDAGMSEKIILPISSMTPQDYTTIQYTTVRILSDISPIVGVDLEIYGPLNKEDVIFLPQKNAEILIEENLASALEI